MSSKAIRVGSMPSRADLIAKEDYGVDLDDPVIEERFDPEVLVKLRSLKTYFGKAGNPTPKDVKRVGDVFAKYKTDHKRMRAVELMASRITHPDKAYRRGLAFVLATRGPAFTEVFINRCWELINEA